MLPRSSTLPHSSSPCNLNAREQCQDSSVCLCVCVRPHLSCSLLQLIYHSVYCVAHSCLFMLHQCKKTAERGAAEDCFCLSSCSILNPASPSNAWWWSSMSGGRGPVQSTPSTFFFFFFFPLLLWKWQRETGGLGLQGSPFDWWNPGQQVTRADYTSFLALQRDIFSKFCVIIMCLEWKRLFKGESCMNRYVALNTKERCHEWRSVRAGGRYPILESLSESKKDQIFLLYTLALLLSWQPLCGNAVRS